MRYLQRPTIGHGEIEPKEPTDLQSLRLEDDVRQSKEERICSSRHFPQHSGYKLLHFLQRHKGVCCPQLKRGSATLSVENQRYC